MSALLILLEPDHDTRRSILEFLTVRDLLAAEASGAALRDSVSPYWSELEQCLSTNLGQAGHSEAPTPKARVVRTEIATLFARRMDAAAARYYKFSPTSTETLYGRDDGLPERMDEDGAIGSNHSEFDFFVRLSRRNLPEFDHGAFYAEMDDEEGEAGDAQGVDDDGEGDAPTVDNDSNMIWQGFVRANYDEDKDAIHLNMRDAFAQMDWNDMRSFVNLPLRSEHGRVNFHPMYQTYRYMTIHNLRLVVVALRRGSIPKPSLAVATAGWCDATFRQKYSHYTFSMTPAKKFRGASWDPSVLAEVTVQFSRTDRSGLTFPPPFDGTDGDFVGLTILENDAGSFVM